MSELARPRRPRVFLRVLGIVLALALTVLACWMVALGHTQKQVSLGVIAGLWAALIGALTMFGGQRHANVHANAENYEGTELELRHSQALESQREVASRRAYEQQLHEMVRREIDHIQKAMSDQLGQLREDVSGLRRDLVEKVGGQIRLERIETTRVIGSDIEALQNEVRRLAVARGGNGAGNSSPAAIAGGRAASPMVIDNGSAANSQSAGGPDLQNANAVVTPRPLEHRDMPMMARPASAAARPSAPLPYVVAPVSSSAPPPMSSVPSPSMSPSMSPSASMSRSPSPSPSSFAVSSAPLPPVGTPPPAFPAVSAAPIVAPAALERPASPSAVPSTAVPPIGAVPPMGVVPPARAVPPMAAVSHLAAPPPSGTVLNAGAVLNGGAVFNGGAPAPAVFNGSAASRDSNSQPAPDPFASLPRLTPFVEFDDIPGSRSNGSAAPSTAQPGSGQSGFGQAGFGQSGSGQPEPRPVTPVVSSMWSSPTTVASDGQAGRRHAAADDQRQVADMPAPTGRRRRPEGETNDILSRLLGPS